jgi:hypothetical protein
MTRVIATLSALLLASAAPARAELPQPLAAVVQMCMTPGPGRAARAMALEQAGLAFVPAEERAEAAAILAPRDLFAIVQFGVLSWQNDIRRNTDRLASGIEQDQGRAVRDAAFRDLFVAGDLTVRIDYFDDSDGAVASCSLALPPGDWAADIGTAIGRPGEVRKDEAHLRFTLFAGEDAPDGVYLVEYRPIAFGGAETAPQLLMPTLPVAP